MSGACSTDGGQQRCIQSFGWEMTEGEQLEDLDTDRRIILKWFIRKWDGLD
jgi:hypothetical protein